MLAVGDEQGGADDGQEGLPAGKAPGHGERQAGQHKGKANPAEPGMTGPGEAALMAEYGQEDTGQKLPRAEGKKVECGGLARRCQSDVGGKRKHKGGDQEREEEAARSLENQDQERQDDVELFFHRQRPGVQQDLVVGADVEITLASPEQDVRQIGRGGDQFLAEFTKFEGQEDKPGSNGRRCGHGKVGGGQTFDAAGVEPGQADAIVAFQIAPEDTADQKS